MASKPPLTALQISARPVIFAGLVCAAAAGVSFWASELAKDVAIEQSSAQTALAAAELALQNTQADRVRLEENLVLFGKLKQTAFIQQPDRLRILEALDAATKVVPLSVIEWELSPQETVKVLVDDKTSAPVGQLVRLPMRIRAEAIHEQEWLTLLGSLKNGTAGYFSTNECTYDRASLSRAQFSVPAVNASCNLAWLYVVPDGAPAKPP